MKNLIKENELDLAVEQIKNNDVICFKTDTVYGFSSSPFSEKAVDRIFELKQRYEGKPLIVLIGKNFAYDEIVYVNDNARKLIKAFWPGPLTIIFKAKTQFASKVTLNGNVSLRMPNDAFCEKLLIKTGPLTSTSANISGSPLLNNPEKIAEIFPHTVVIDSGVPQNSQPSTIVDATADIPVVLREGSITKVDIEKFCNTL